LRAAEYGEERIISTGKLFVGADQETFTGTLLPRESSELPDFLEINRSVIKMSSLQIHRDHEHLQADKVLAALVPQIEDWSRALDAIGTRWDDWIREVNSQLAELLNRWLEIKRRLMKCHHCRRMFETESETESETELENEPVCESELSLSSYVWVRRSKPPIYEAGYEEGYNDGYNERSHSDHQLRNQEYNFNDQSPEDEIYDQSPEDEIYDQSLEDEIYDQSLEDEIDDQSLEDEIDDQSLEDQNGYDQQDDHYDHYDYDYRHCDDRYDYQREGEECSDV